MTYIKHMPMFSWLNSALVLALLLFCTRGQHVYNLTVLAATLANGGNLLPTTALLPLALTLGL